MAESAHPPAPATTPAPAPAPAGGPMLIAVGQYATFTLSFIDGLEPQLGPMSAPGVGTISALPPNIVEASASIVGGGVTIRLNALNVGKTEVTYTYDENVLKIPVEVVRREATSVVLNKDSVSHYPLP